MSRNYLWHIFGSDSSPFETPETLSRLFRGQKSNTNFLFFKLSEKIGSGCRKRRAAKGVLGGRKWGCNKWGLKGCLATLPGNRPKSAFFGLFRPFPVGPNSTWKIQKTEEKGLFPEMPSDLLKPPSLKPPFAAPQEFDHFFSFSGLFRSLFGHLLAGMGTQPSRRFTVFGGGLGVATHHLQTTPFLLLGGS